MDTTQAYQDARVYYAGQRLGSPQQAGGAPEPSIMQVLQALNDRMQQLEKQMSINADETRFVRARLGI
jgi:hypothetical protein